MSHFSDNKIEHVGSIIIRPEREDEHYAVELLTREAFWGFFRPDCDEHYIVHRLRRSAAFIPELDFVAECEGKLIGNIMYSKAKVVDDADFEHEVITFGPLSVMPEYQNKGVGSALLRHSILAARDMGFGAIVFYGHPDYYPRFGFQNAEVFGITDPKGRNFDALMAMELYDGALHGISGRFFEDDAFDCDKTETEKYNKNFPHKEPVEMISINVLLDQLPGPARRIFTERKMQNLALLNHFSGREMLGWDGADEGTILIVNRVLREHNYAPKLLPGCEILERAKQGIRLLETK